MERLKRRDDRNEPGPIAKLLMAASALLVALLLAYLLYQAVTTPREGEPAVEIASLTTLPDGDVRVEIRVTNDAARGLRDLTASVDCDDPPPELGLANIPARGERRGVILCPPGTVSPDASISAYSWT